jgi:hypothetical protein
VPNEIAIELDSLGSHIQALNKLLLHNEAGSFNVNPNLWESLNVTQEEMNSNQTFIQWLNQKQESANNKVAIQLIRLLDWLGSLTQLQWMDKEEFVLRSSPKLVLSETEAGSGAFPALLQALRGVYDAIEPEVTPIFETIRRETLPMFQQLLATVKTILQEPGSLTNSLRTVLDSYISDPVNKEVPSAVANKLRLVELHKQLFPA